MKPQDQAPSAQPELAHNEAASRYELHLNGQLLAQADYRLQGDTMRFTHTEVQPQYEGQGLGSRIAAFALDDAKSRGLKVRPQCPFIAKYIEKHEKEYGDLLVR
jgi:uncharacterized protein